uniref:Uncharacterized protein n=1 Tax=Ascaris lumbricoides TaxID=6252 RepID=A0A9J2PWP4_ASCLU
MGSVTLKRADKEGACLKRRCRRCLLVSLHLLD